MALLGCASSPRSTSSNSHWSPAALASSYASRRRRSSGGRPIRPPTMARWVPWPSPVAANEPCRRISARSGVPPAMARAICPRRQAPAVCELLGPTMVGPRMSKSETMSAKIRSGAETGHWRPRYGRRARRRMNARSVAVNRVARWQVFNRGEGELGADPRSAEDRASQKSRRRREVCIPLGAFAACVLPFLPTSHALSAEFL